jgi:hypothetical protein
MKVKIAGVVHDSNLQPIAILLTAEEKKLIQDMGEAHHFCVYPVEYAEEFITEFMKFD